VNRINPYHVLGLPTDPDLTDEQIRDAWLAIAAATHPDRGDGGDTARYSQASAAYAELRSPWGRSEAYADVIEQLYDTTPLPLILPGPGTAAPPLTFRPLLLLPSRIRHGRPLRMLIRAAAAALISLAILRLVPGTAAAPADITGMVLWFGLTARSDLAPPPRK
jgi:hypothetical protein